MAIAVTNAQALKGREPRPTTDPNVKAWRRPLIGRKSDGVGRNEPQAFVVEMNPHEVIPAHFHEVDQFQVFVAGEGALGRSSEKAKPVTVHYADDYTAYGPIVAGPQGSIYYTLRAKTDVGIVLLDKPGYREKLKPSRKRHFTHNIAPSAESVLHDRHESTLETLHEKEADGLAAYVARIRPGMDFSCPDPQGTGGQYHLVIGGVLELDRKQYETGSVVFVGSDEPPLQIRSGDAGLELLMVQYPQRH